MTVHEKEERRFKIIEDMTLNDIEFIENNDLYYKGDYGYIIKICGNVNIAKWRRGQFSVPNSEDIYIYAINSNDRYIKSSVIEDYSSIEDAKLKIYNYLKTKLKYSKENKEKLKEYINKMNKKYN